MVHYSTVKRIIDIVLSLIAVVCLSPLSIVIGIALKLENYNEPILFSQERVGQFGNVFKIYKFRSFSSEAPDNVPSMKFNNYKRFSTKLGRTLRNTSVDEIPQFVNVLKGNMSIVGPRPLIKEEGDIHNRRLELGIYELKPGITGLAQINGGNQITNEEKLWWDNLYLHRSNILLDMWIGFHTIVPLNSNNLINAWLIKRGTLLVGEYKEEWKKLHFETGTNNN